jgi:hypothetical protein
VYPSSDPVKTWNQFKDKISDLVRFDISAFGIQYPRVFLQIAVDVLNELYPCTVMQEQHDLVTEVLTNVTVTLPDETVVKPIRGIGLGYFEDLKTLFMLSVLDKHNPISVYGDQGILPLTGLGAIEDLIQAGFILKFEKIEFVASTNVLLWGGNTMQKYRFYRRKAFLAPLLESFFSRTHWERKNALLSVAKDNYELYTRVFKARLYQRFFSYEFFPGDYNLHVEQGGLRLDVPYVAGYNKLYRLRHFMMPKQLNYFSISHNLPHTVRRETCSNKVAIAFSKKRFSIYRSTRLEDDAQEYNIYPRYTYNADRPSRAPSTLPNWAELALIYKHGCHTGAFTYGVDPSEFLKTVEQFPYASNPFEARARGGYKLQSGPFLARPMVNQDWKAVAVKLQQLEEYSNTLKVNRIDLPLNIWQVQDERYETEVVPYLRDTLKRKRSVASLVTSSSDKPDEDRAQVLIQERAHIMDTLLKKKDPSTLLRSLIEEKYIEPELVDSESETDIPFVEEDSDDEPFNVELEDL